MDLNKIIEIAESTILPTIFDILEVNYTVIDAEGNYIVYNNTVENIVSGQKKAQNIDTASWEDCKAVMKSGVKKTTEEHFGNKYFLSVKQPLKNNGESIGIMVLSVDITAQKKAELAKEEFIASMSHDLRTPFLGIYSLSQYLRDTETNPERKDLQNDVVESSERLLALVNQVIDIISFKSTVIDSEKKLFNISDLINDVVKVIMPTVKSKGVKLVIHCSQVEINANKESIYRILLNLVGNAFKFTNEGSVTIDVKINSALNISVIDTGIGIEKEHLDSVFDKFFKVTSSYSQQTFTGSGIGLFLTKEAVEKLNGTITVESELGKGTSFFVSIPLETDSIS